MDNTAEWFASLQGTSTRTLSPLALFVPRVDHPNDDYDGEPHTAERNGGFVVDLSNGEVDVSIWAPAEYIIPRDYKSVILTYLPKLIAAKEVARLFPLLKLHPALKVGFANPHSRHGQ